MRKIIVALVIGTIGLVAGFGQANAEVPTDPLGNPLTTSTEKRDGWAPFVPEYADLISVSDYVQPEDTAGILYPEWTDCGTGKTVMLGTYTSGPLDGMGVVVGDYNGDAFVGGPVECLDLAYSNEAISQRGE